MSLEFSRIGFAPDFVDYQEGWDLQRRIHSDVVAGTAEGKVLLLEHSPVYTAGKRTEEHEKPFDGTPIINVDRGGKLTWHGPGQLVGYPILALPDPTKVADYVDILEQVLINVLADFGINGSRIEGRSGVWIKDDGDRQDRKIAAIGIRVNHRVTMHGFALNCNNDLAPYAQIIACGITDAGTTSMSVEAGRNISPADVAGRVEEELNKYEAALVKPAGLPENNANTAGTSQPEGALK
ncbi:lipoyl(octanoyl) transferase LipB [Arthrobacter crystallopoietes]|uniref:lipoyl(octanoyl) transferase LipB n=1 Tax=Crystallibacter crystallopoietes TaxID=37928 RepID=UPI001ABED135|nr:lipoyl(octanoyl) transferase LipB [Arthrobacter crystallopoietes]QTG79934.1 lipoyl(octanoyl) transferase LipB [Arthrobacter crystallopoietes]